MDFIGMGPLEIVLILIIGFLFFGPEKLPAMAAKAGRLMRNFSKAANELNKTLSEEVSIEKDLKEIKTGIEQEVQSIIPSDDKEVDQKKPNTSVNK